ncbi:Structural maintenance of chromosomes protein 1 [Quaeritorhiza haematococci]|nr:Structural maintenance of chromosomes protein 1 [Quaeritorhiza haematococci]
MGRLVHLEVENFKSYKGIQKIGPFFNFTSVIGPNGSGKSNLMDAVSFVLGVKSSQLRSTQLKELIYRGGHHDTSSSGADPESSPGKENHPDRASVTALYQKSNGQELRFTRIITAAGASEYKINGKSVPYSKYNAALEAENILVKARNFLVFQGDVEAVAAQSPRDLTRLIEQISGSLDLKAEYERLKALQEKATENSTLNFNKKRGINAEMKQFKEQKEEAQRFEKLQEKRTKTIITHLLWKLYHLEKNGATLRWQIKEEQSAFTEINEQQAQLEADLKDARKQQANVNKEVLKAEKKIKDKEKTLDEKKPEGLALEQKIKHSERKLKHAQDNLQRAQKEEEKMNESLKILQNELRELEKASQKFEENFKKQSQEAAGPTLDDDEIAEYNRKKEEVSRQTALEKEKLISLQRDLRPQETKKQQKTEALENHKRKRQELRTEIEKLQEREEKCKSELVQLTQEAEKARQEYDSFEIEKRALRQKEQDLTERLQEVSEQLQQAKYDRLYSEKNKKMKECFDTLKKTYPGVHGRVLDLVKPNARKYETAISVLLGRHMDSVVVDTEKIAIECIQFIRDQRIGQATFLPLDTIQVKPINEKYRSSAISQSSHDSLTLIWAPVVIVPLFFPFSHKTAEAQFEPVIQHICGNALVCETTDVAKYIVYEKKEEVKCVIFDGTVFHKAGLITGGQTKDSNGSRRWEEKEIDKLAAVREKLSNDLVEIQGKARKLGHADQLRATLTMAQDKRANIKKDLDTTQQKLHSQRRELEHVGSRIAALEPEIQQLTTALEEHQFEIDTLDAQIQSIESRIFQDFCSRVGLENIRDFEQRQLKYTQEVTERKLGFTTQTAKLSNQIEFETQQKQELVKRISTIASTLDSEQTTLDNLKAAQADLLEETNALKEEVETLMAKMQDVKKELESKAAEVSKVKKELSKVAKELEGKSKSVSVKEAQIEKFLAERYSILRKCKLEKTELPFERGSLDDLSLDEVDRGNEVDEDSMDIDGGGGSSSSASLSQQSQAQMDNLKLDYSMLKRDQKENDSPDLDLDFQETIKNLGSEIERITPNLKALDRLGDVENKFKETAEEFDHARRQAKEAKDRFNAIKQQRYQKFYAAYSHIAQRIDEIYKELTRSKTFPLGGTAYLSLEDSEEPYNDGVKYHAMPPMKRFRDMEQLSGGEKTVAALALLFAIHSYQPAPFFVLDEVDAALDNTNVAKVANYIRKHASDSFQFIVISLKSSFYEKAEALVGIYRDQQVRSSKILTLKLDGQFG